MALPVAVSTPPSRMDRSVPGADSPVLPKRESASADLGFFLSLSRDFPLLDADAEKRFSYEIWSARRRLDRAIQKAYRTEGETALGIPRSERAHTRPLSTKVADRLYDAELYARVLVKSLEDRVEPGPPPERRGRSSSATGRTLTLAQAQSIASVLHEELDRITEAGERLVRHNLRLVVWVAKSYQRRGLDLPDLVQEGSLGLMRAISRFDPAVGTRLSTFATYAIRLAIRRALAEKGRLIRIPIHRLTEVREALMARSHLAKSLDRTPETSEIAFKIGSEPCQVEELFRALAPVDSIDDPIAGTDIIRGETLVDEESTSPFDATLRSESVDSVREALGRMGERDKTILAMRYGIGYPRECTLEEIGLSLGLSRERVRQLEKVAREKLRGKIAAN